MAFLLILILTAVVGVLLFILSVQKTNIHGLPEPPGNFALGHALRLGQNCCATFLKWKQLVGPVYQIRILNYRMVILNDKESITQVCTMPQSAGRAQIGILKRLDQEYGSGFTYGEGPVCEDQRVFFSKAFKTHGISLGGIEKTVLDGVRDCFQDWEKLNGEPFDLENFSAVCIFNTFWSMLASKGLDVNQVLKIGRELKQYTDMDTVMDKLAIAVPDFVDMFSGFARKKLDAYRTVLEVVLKTLSEHRSDRIANEPRNIIDEFLEKIDQIEGPDPAPEASNNSNYGLWLMEIIMASAEPTTKTLEWFMLYVSQHPTVQRKLHSEIDRVLKGQLRPSLSDKDQMPYTKACIWETLRLSSALPFGVPHKAMEDFELNGAVVPKGTLLIMNQYAVHRDPQVWDRPTEFDPERFLTPAGEFDIDVKNKTLPFGAGRRNCIGSGVGLDTIFLYITSVFQKFDMELVGQLDSLEGKFGFASSPVPGLKLRAIPRNKSTK